MEEHSYWEHIERYFVEKRGNSLILSPKDWPLVASWQERHIPLEVIYQGINTAFERFEEQQTSGQRRSFQTLASCKYDIETSWKRWKEEHPEVHEPDEQDIFEAECRKLVTKLRSTAAQLRQYMMEAHYSLLHEALSSAVHILEAGITTVEEAGSERAVADIREKVLQAEQQLLSHLEEQLPEDIRREFYQKAEARLASHKHQMNASVYEETLQLVFRQELHHAYPLPSFL